MQALSRSGVAAAAAAAAATTATNVVTAPAGVGMSEVQAKRILFFAHIILAIKFDRTDRNLPSAAMTVKNDAPIAARRGRR